MAPCLLFFLLMLRLSLSLFIFAFLVSGVSFAEMWDGYSGCDTVFTPEPPKLVLPPLSIQNLFEKNLAGQFEYNLEDASLALSSDDRERIVQTLLLDRVGFFGRFGVSVVKMADKPFSIPHLISDAQKLRFSTRANAKDFHIQFGKISLALFYSAFAYEYRASGKIKLNTIDLGLGESTSIYLSNSSTESEHADTQTFLKWLNENPARATYAAHVFGEALNALIDPIVYRSYMLASDNYKRDSFNPKKWNQLLKAQAAPSLNPLNIMKRRQIETLRRQVVDRLRVTADNSQELKFTSDLYMAQTPLLSVEQAPYMIGASFAVDFMTVLDLKDFKSYKNKTLAALEIAQTYAEVMATQSANLVDLTSQPNLSPKRLYTLRTILDAMTEDAGEMEPILKNTLSVLSAARAAAANGAELKSAEAEAYKEQEAQLTMRIEKAKSIEKSIEATKANLKKANSKLNN